MSEMIDGEDVAINKVY